MQELRDAAELIRNADALLIGAGAGMGVDSGLPDFRGATGATVPAHSGKGGPAIMSAAGSRPG